jgi:hypothetical protein
MIVVFGDYIFMSLCLAVPQRRFATKLKPFRHPFFTKIPLHAAFYGIFVN